MLLTASLLFAVSTSVHVRIQPDEANAVLAILDKRAAQKPVDEADWRALFATDGYVRLQKRERSMRRKFEDDDFRAFVLSDGLLARRAELHRVMDMWLGVDLHAAAARALAYLPAGATIDATIYPVIKPQKNSFVFEGNAIFKYVEDESKQQFESIIAHELHHIGYDSACPPHDVAASIETLPERQQKIANWLTGFGEGFATLAAAGGPDADPQRYAKEDVRAAWAEGMRKYDSNFRDVEQFFAGILDGRLTGDAIRDRGFEFFGLVGPWYTVGWKMCVVIEKTLGRHALIEAFCDPRTLLATYNRAAVIWKRRTGESLPLWNERLVAAFAAVH
jgi:hypothetical protein